MLFRLPRWALLLSGLLLALSFFFANFGQAASNNSPDVRLIIDISGSMKRTDPNNLRIPATNLLIDLLPENSQAGIWTFGAYVNQLVPYNKVNTSWRDNARRQANKINSVAMFTDIENAIERASWDIKTNTSSADKHLILLSDGLVDISEAATANAREAENLKSRDYLLRQKAKELAEAGYLVHTLALSDEADLDLMATLAQRTGGLHAVAYKDTDLMPLLLQILNRLAPSDEVALENNKFLIDSSIDEFTLLAFHTDNADASLVSPTGKSFTAKNKEANQRWHTTNNYTLVTISQPEAGSWQLQTPEHPDNRVTVVSDVRLEADKLAPTLFRGYPVELEAWLSESHQPITRQEFLQLLKVEASLTKAGQKQLTQNLELNPETGKFTLALSSLTQPPGEYSFKLELDGQTFNRQLNQSINLQDIVAANLQLPEDGSSPRIILRAQHPELNPTEINFLVNTPAANLTAEYRGDGEWKIDLSQLNPSQAHPIELLAKVNQGETPLTINLPSVTLPALVAAPPAEAVQPEPKAEPVIEVEETPAEPQPEPVIEEPAPSSEPEPEEQPEEASEPSWWKKLLNSLLGDTLAPIEDWEDSRMPLIYIGLGVANLLVFIVAVVMYRRFLKKRLANKGKSSKKKKKKKAADDDEEDFDDLDDLDELDDLDSLDDR